MAVPIQGLRSRVERLLRGDVRTDDLIMLFLFAREETDGGRESVAEIGNFTAHKGERERGVITQHAKEFFQIIHFHARRIMTPLVAARLPKDTPDFLRTNLNWTPNAALKQNLQIGLAQARKMLPELLTKLQVNADGTWAMTPILRPDEIALINYLCAALTTRPAFTGERLVDDLLVTLLKTQVLRPAERRAFLGARPIIEMFALSILNNSTVVLDDGSRAHLHLKEGNAEGHLQIFAIGPPVTDKNARMATAMFSTTLDVSTYCEPGLTAALDAEPRDIEITSARRLGIIA